MALLSSQSLCIGYAGKPLATNLHLSPKPGQFTALLGLNGAGKSTLLRTLAGLQPALSGQVLLGGKPIEKLGPQILSRSISLVLTARPSVQHLSVRELLALGRSPHTGWGGRMQAQDWQAVERALEWVGLSHYAHREANSLSDGEFQKAMIGRALAQDTPFLLLDEPTAHLDVPNRISIFSLLQTLASETGKAVLIATHELDMALAYCHQIWALSPQGLFQGTPQTLLHSGALARAFPTLPQGFLERFLETNA